MTKNITYQDIAKTILGLIESGVFPSGSRLPSLEESAKSLGVSRGGVREARIALEAQGYIELKGHFGAYVVDNKLNRARGLPKVSPLELTEARALFEAESAALAAPIITPEALLELEKYVSLMSGSEANAMTAEEADEAFHKTIARSTGNKMIMFVIESMWKTRTENSELEKVYQKVCDKDPKHREQEHQAILQALKDRDPIAARAAMRLHFTNIIQSLLEASEEEAYQNIKRKTSEKRSRFLLANQIAI